MSGRRLTSQQLRALSHSELIKYCAPHSEKFEELSADDQAYFYSQVADARRANKEHWLFEGGVQHEV